MTGRAKCKRTRFGGNKWIYVPADKKREKDLKQTIPKIQTSQSWGPITYQIDFCSTLEPSTNGTSEWVINSGYEKVRPRIKKYLVVIPEFMMTLRKWRR